ncbi:mannonate dehydratase [Elizabethkingia anophelis]|uniref:Mannonate dehydratase n=1 Tax=Elizabethkingia anophelis TaxID=1117645 RepID=A0A7Z7LXT3_9FLAO|nr:MULTISPECIES: mannonate dehydratase [Elizabethkingia]MBG0504704.1 mannonate dehydratase [Elizabethkingia anophelis]MCT3629568.1 mannonate dehydratase [Elizabethkingia anophelis]MCT3632585.1 mannonate dehydratase [Elizabethkingia anophelis]MCT3673008.1 mannonate dehydratase [Elizabethkingia anophelis]MCT3680503.1 mannonate dehydratase [Elizabethkingia anophelis]
MRRLEQTWRWYGPEDPVSLQDIKQAGATGIVTALHHIPHGEIWPLDEIAKRKKIIEEAGFRWSVVESVPVHEAIKTRSEHVTHYIANYRQTLKNLAENGIKTVCYNFMPVLDWTRTQLDLELKDGSKALYFNWIDLAVFDLFMLKRKNAEADYTDSVRKEAKERFENYTNEQLNQLQMNILMGIPGEKNIEIEELNKSIELYSTIGAEGLRQNLLYFLQSIADICEEYGISMTIHPDDPPYPILGLPRIAGNLEDFKYIIRGVDKKFNGICFCTGSLGAGKAEQLAQMFSELKDRVYFIHLRNVQKDAHGNFYEADHLDGDVNMYEVMKVIAEENQKRETAIPFRPDHGHQMLDDLQKTTNPGYSAIGRLRGLAELRGLELGILGK